MLKSQWVNLIARDIDITKGMFAWTYQPAYQLESTVFFSHNKTVSASLSAGFNTNRTVHWYDIYLQVDLIWFTSNG